MCFFSLPHTAALSHDPLTAQDRISQAGGRLAKILQLRCLLTNEPPTESSWQLTSANMILLSGKQQILKKKKKVFFQSSLPDFKEAVKRFDFIQPKSSVIWE